MSPRGAVADDLIVRQTVWFTWERSEDLQASIALLDGLWEPLMERTLPCGPFHPISDRLSELHDDARRWLRQCGYQLELL